MKHEHHPRTTARLALNGKVYHMNLCDCGHKSYDWHLVGQNFYCCDESIIKTVPTIGVSE